ncbi:flagellar protein MotY [Photobacterium gaetbulicola]|uniref:Putative sodium-type flagellar protein MotY n=2 Tax=Photobacterium gaetbulicola TaxID=1295392 RepID=A0A0C5WYC5_9GAMM|nr:putative sodium-type flagellar protein MotY [Photobacterium gaetbulicola Gung47]PSU13114.1 flagellar protein MotY [Photobacterium gaetbulicola]
MAISKFQSCNVAFMLGMVMASAASATPVYVAEPAQSTWKVAVDTPLECRMLHTIPSYGEAQFTSKASKKINLDFELKMRRPMGETRNVNLVSMPPRWMPGEAAQSITNLTFFKQFDGYVGGQTAWVMLSELEIGRYPTFSYQDWQQQNKRIEVGLSAVAFRPAYDQFSQCLNNLLPYSFEDIAFTVLHYDQGSDQLNKASQQRLAQIADFVRYSDDVDLVLVAAYTDGRGGKTANQALSERRAERLEEYFMAMGLPEDRIQVEAYGERRPVADNNTPIGRNKNRRVVISLGRTII